MSSKGPVREMSSKTVTEYLGVPLPELPEGYRWHDWGMPSRQLRFDSSVQQQPPPLQLFRGWVSTPDTPDGRFHVVVRRSTASGVNTRELRRNVFTAEEAVALLHMCCLLGVPE